MKQFKKTVVFILIISLLLVFVPVSAFAASDEIAQNQAVEEKFVFNDSGDFAVIYEDKDKNSQPIRKLQNGTVVYVLESLKQFTKIQYEDIISQELVTGFIESKFLISGKEYEGIIDSTQTEDSQELETGISSTNESQEFGNSKENDKDSKNVEKRAEENRNLEEKTQTEVSEQKESTLSKAGTSNLAEFSTANSTVLEGAAIKNQTNMYAKPSRNSNVLRTFDAGKLLKYYTYSSEWYTSYIMVNGQNTQIYIHKDDVVNQTQSAKLLEGISRSTTTNMYQAPSKGSNVLRVFESGKYLKFYTFSDEWYRSNITVDGKVTTIYIYKDDIELPTVTPELQSGIALKNPTNMYQSPTIESKVVKTFNSGKELKYYTYTKDWYRSTVTVNGKVTTIYIKKSDVEPLISKPQLQEGIAWKNPTNMYASASRNSKVLRTFGPGSILKYYTYSSNWYKSTTTVNGKLTTIYIHKDDIELPTVNPELQSGIALKNPTNMYQSPTIESKVVKTFNSGKELKYYTYTKDWYRSTVTVNGKVTTIYIKKSDVEPLISKPQLQEGIAWKNPTNMYASASRNSKVLRTFGPGSILKYYTYSSNWYKSTTTVNGKLTTIYIHKDDIEEADPSSEVINGLALKNPTNVYSLPSSGAIKLRSYSKGSFLKFYNYSKNWYKSTVWVDGKGYVTCYIKKSDVTTSEILISHSNYNIKFSDFVKIQANNSPKEDGSGLFVASEQLVMYYANPLNFDLNSMEYYQFLDLSVPLNLNRDDAKIINEKILKGKNKLENTAQAFIDAGKKYGVNALYLIAHALHETNNGKSDLANGIKVNGKTVYNFFGYSAIDGNASGGGSQYAYQQGWFTPNDAIMGGVANIAKNYIYRANGPQNTLYKMRWNPANPGEHQYATHVAWATAQTSRIYSYYELLGIQQFIFDVPTFANQPGPTAEPTGAARYAVLNVPVGLTGTLTENVNFRTYPSTASSSNVIKTLPGGTVIDIIGTNGGWYKAKVNGTLGWLSGDYVSVKNGLLVTASALNVRSSPSGSIIGTVYNGEIVKVYLNSDGSYVMNNGWYKIYYKNTTGWASGDYLKQLRR